MVRTKTSLIAAMVIGVFCLLLAMDYLLPYSFDHFRRIEAMHLLGQVSGWLSTGGRQDDLKRLQKTNSQKTVFIFKTNLVISGRSYNTVLAVQNASFRGKGFLTITTNLDILWISRQGRSEVLTIR